MPALPKHISDFMAKHEVDADEIWQVHGNSWVIKHKALERVAAKAKIVFDRPAIIESDAQNNTAVVCVFGTMDDRAEWSFGEASPANYRVSGKQAAYPYAMAEKRGKDRVILKLLNAHGSLYSEDEADEFKRENPHVTRPTDIVPDVEYDQYGQPVDNIPNGDDAIERLPKAKAKADFAACQAELQAIKTVRDLDTWGAKNANRIASFPNDWQAIMRGLYAEHRDELRKELADA